MSKAVLKYLRMAPRKVRVVAGAIRGKKAEWALDYLRFCPRRGARPLYKLVRSALSNATQKKGVDVDQLIVKELRIDGGPSLKRSLPRAKGRADPILKRTSHITLTLEAK